MGSQRVRHDLLTEHNTCPVYSFSKQVTTVWDILLLKVYFTAVAYPKFRCNWVSCIVSDDPTRE